ncbi:hypothetical protein ACJ72_07847 [Emergomyces africanus]|uniref:Uncharacterized protein n=1 Tax=Emergomyces africanus TaxID=1955775 RepID=A0A1B7NLY9_9EURO|nr:hypothetical protein ACJ72_07847 [Emergomyces africanus]
MVRDIEEPLVPQLEGDTPEAKMDWDKKIAMWRDLEEAGLANHFNLAGDLILAYSSINERHAQSWNLWIERSKSSPVDG